MGWKSGYYEKQRRRSNARSFMTIKHSAAQHRLQTLLSAHGVAVLEHPWCVNAKGINFGHDTLWRYSDTLFGDGPSYELLISYGYSPVVIVDLACATDDGVITSAFEVVAFASPNSAKLALLKTLSFPVYSVSADAALALTPECPWLPLAFNPERVRSLGHPFQILNRKPHVPRLVVPNFETLIRGAGKLPAE